MYHAADQLSQPFTFLWILSAVALAIMWRRSAFTLTLLLGVGVIGIGIVSTSAVAGWAVEALERQFPAVPAEAIGGDAIVVLSGTVLEGDGQSIRPTLGPSSMARTLHAARIYRARPARPIIVTGGHPTRNLDVAPLMAEFLVELGVSADDILIEPEAMTTYEHAIKVAPLLRAHGLRRPALVTEATHLPRALRVFEAQGIDVIPAGCCYRTLGIPKSLWQQWVPTAFYAWRFQVAAHEWIGGLWYELRGYLRPAVP